MAKWFEMFRANPDLAKQLVAKAVAEVNQPDVEEEAVVKEFTTYCTECGEPQHDLQGLAVHMARAHHIKRAIRAYLSGSDCLVCGIRFASRQRLVDHVAEKSPICAFNYRRRYQPLPPDEVEALDLQGRAHFARRLRVEGAHGIRVHGPFLLVFGLDGVPITTRHPLGPNRRWNG